MDVEVIEPAAAQEEDQRSGQAEEAENAGPVDAQGAVEEARRDPRRREAARHRRGQ
ncbi:hypothetical protein [Streptomyces wuyuanensis]|uniref:hypothetical protein n=1 Tax=Streptomyces wuyuanensis TaxID=1196353 RepID=UPI003D746FFD